MLDNIITKRGIVIKPSMISLEMNTINTIILKYRYKGSIQKKYNLLLVEPNEVGD